MAFSINKVILVGNVGREPEVRTTQSGAKLATFSVATTDSWKDKNSGERKEQTEWHRVVVFNSALAEICEKYVHKGTRLYIEGQLQTRKWTDSNNVEKYTTEVIVQGFKGDLVIMNNEKMDSSVSFDNVSMNSSSDFGGDDIPF